MGAKPHAHVSLITLGVADVERAAQFYEQLGFKRKMRKADGVAFFEAGAVVLSLYGKDALASTPGSTPETARGFGRPRSPGTARTKRASTPCSRWPPRAAQRS